MLLIKMYSCNLNTGYCVSHTGYVLILSVLDNSTLFYSMEFVIINPTTTRICRQ